MVLSQSQRKLYAKAATELANIAAGAMIFGQFLAGQPLAIGAFISGFIITVVLYFGAYVLTKEGAHPHSHGI
jgi:hypothetical protein